VCSWVDLTGGMYTASGGGRGGGRGGWRTERHGAMIVESISLGSCI
jgi:hypothetical protein